MSAPCRLHPYQYLTPYYGPTVPCNAQECDPCNPKLWNQNVQTQFNPTNSNNMCERNINQGGWRTAFGWHGDLNARQYAYQFFDEQIKTPINFYFPNWPHTDYNWEKCQSNQK